MSLSEVCEDMGIPPCNFSWVVEGKLAAMGWPQTAENLKYIVRQGVKYLITLSPERLPPINEVPELEWTEIPICEFEAPSLPQIFHFINICQKCLSEKKAIGIHCRQGKGRTGVMAACYLVHFQNLSPERAIINIRMQRPGSIETPQQERIVFTYHDYICSQLR